MVIFQDDGTVEFAYFRPGADSVSLAGDFNSWQAASHPMRRDSDGWWRLQLALPGGEYRFKYVVDHCIWEADFAAYGVEMCKVGGWNSVLYVSPQTTTARKAAAA